MTLTVYVDLPLFIHRQVEERRFIRLTQVKIILQDKTNKCTLSVRACRCHNYNSSLLNIQSSIHDVFHNGLKRN